MKHIYNVVPSPPDPKNFLFVERLASAPPVVLPPSVDISKNCSPIVDQGQLGSCTANALASGLREFLLLKYSKPLVRLSRLFLYYEERAAEGSINQDAGANLKDGLDCLLKLGVCKESLDPYDITSFSFNPSAAALAEAKDYKITKYMKINDLGAAKACLALGFPVVIAMNVFSQMESDQAANTGIVSLPSKNEQPLGGHAVTLVGYRDTPRFQPGYWKGGGYLLVRNSWGNQWGCSAASGEKGYFKVSYQYATTNNIFEYWTAR